MPRRRKYRHRHRLSIVLEALEADCISSAAREEGISMSEWMRGVLLTELQRLDVVRKLETAQPASQ